MIDLRHPTPDPERIARAVAIAAKLRQGIEQVELDAQLWRSRYNTLRQISLAVAIVIAIGSLLLGFLAGQAYHFAPR